MSGLDEVGHQAKVPRCMVWRAMMEKNSFAWFRRLGEVGVRWSPTLRAADAATSAETSR